MKIPFFLLAFLCFCLQLQAQTVQDQRIVIDDDDLRDTEGDVVELLNGNLMIAWSDFTGNSDFAPAVISYKISTDGGQSWTPKSELQGNIGLTTFSPSFLRSSQTGDLFLFFISKPDSQSCHIFFRKSSNDGLTWTSPIQITPPGGYYVLNNARVIQTSGGRILIPTAFTPNIHNYHQILQNRFLALAFYSDDEGLTWQQSAKVCVDQYKGAMEPGLVELPDGKINMLIRTAAGKFYSASSNDGGISWSGACTSCASCPSNAQSKAVPYQPSTTYDLNNFSNNYQVNSWMETNESPGTIVRIPATGDLLMVYNPKNFPGYKRTPLVAAISHDDGFSWKRYKDLEAHNPNIAKPNLAAYSSITFSQDQLRALLSYNESEWNAAGGFYDARMIFRNLALEWFYDDPEYPNEIAGDKAWDDVRMSMVNITVEPGTTFVVKGKLIMGSGRKIIVKPGGTLIIDGGMITGREGEMWAGIEVWGNSFSPQMAYGIPDPNQGTVIVQNSGVISHAQFAVRAEQPGMKSGGGGRVFADHGIFRNNEHTVLMSDYGKKNHSFFRECLFISDDYLPLAAASGGKDAAAGSRDFIQLTHVSGVKISGNRFISMIPLPAGEKPIAIKSMNASYIVDDICMAYGPGGCISSIPNQFIGLFAGIDFQSTLNGSHVMVKGNYFERVDRSVTIQGGMYSIVDGNTFAQIPGSMPGQFANATWGVGLLGSFGCAVRDNSFNSAVKGTFGNHWPRGVWAANTWRGNTEIRNNYFTGNLVGIQAQQNNATLQVKCNTFDDCFAIAVTSGKFPSQGACMADHHAPAGNEFLHSSNIHPEQDIYFRSTSNPVAFDQPFLEYSHHGPRYQQDPVIPVHVTAGTVLKTDCSFFKTGSTCDAGSISSNGSLAELRIHLNNVNAQLDYAENQYRQELEAFVLANMNTIKADTGGLSGLEMHASVEDPVFMQLLMLPIPEITDMLQSAGAEKDRKGLAKIYEWLSKGLISSDPIPGSTQQRQELLAASEVYHQLKIEKEQTLNEIIRRLITEERIDEARATISAIGIPTLGREFLPFSSGIGNIGSTGNYDGLLSEQQQAYLTFQELMAGITEDENLLTEAGEQEVRWLSEMALSDYPVSYAAQAFLSNSFQLHFARQPEGIEWVTIPDATASDETKAGHPVTLSIFPNPASGHSTLVVYDGEVPVTEVRVFSSSGEEVMRKKGKNIREMDLDATGLSSGVYIIECINEGRVCGEIKWMIIRN